MATGINNIVIEFKNVLNESEWRFYFHRVFFLYHRQTAVVGVFHIESKELFVDESFFDDFTRKRFRDSELREMVKDVFKLHYGLEIFPMITKYLSASRSDLW